MEYDLFLAGPWEQFSPEKYKTKIKQAFPNKRIFDPEADPSQKKGDWFETNYDAIKTSERMICYVSSLPFPGNAFEAGMFYLYQRERNLYMADKMIVIWKEDIQPAFGKDVIRRCPAIVLNNTEKAISLLKIIFNGESPTS